jgi:hypothetical protein
LKAQSASTEHGFVPHAVPRHTYGSHFVRVTGQLPLPSHDAASVSKPSSQLASWQATIAPANWLQSLRSMPSHCFAEHGCSEVPLEHGGRGACGAPTTAVHVPSVPAASHASHWPVQGELQQ